MTKMKNAQKKQGIEELYYKLARIKISSQLTVREEFRRIERG
jgi:hypothetical protein